MLTRTVSAVLICLCLAVQFAASTGAAQQVLEIDYDAGRTVIDDEQRGIYNTLIDHERSILYAYDTEEPEGVMAFSLDTGEWMRTVRFPTGGGPQELPQGFAGMSVAPRGGLFVAGVSRVLQFDANGQYVSDWTPLAPERKGAICSFDGNPAVPTANGIVRRTGDGEETIGPGADALNLSQDQLRGMADRIPTTRTRSQCTTGAAEWGACRSRPNLPPSRRSRSAQRSERMGGATSSSRPFPTSGCWTTAATVSPVR